MFSNRYEPITQAYGYESSVSSEINADISVIDNGGTSVNSTNINNIVQAFNDLETIVDKLSTLSYYAASRGSDLGQDLAAYSNDAKMQTSFDGASNNPESVINSSNSPVTFGYFDTTDGGDTAKMQNDSACYAEVDIGLGIQIPENLSAIASRTSVTYYINISAAAINDIDNFSL